MGGYGSGRRSTKPKVEECSSIDANQLNRDGCLKNGWNGTMAWSRNGKKFSSIGIRATANYLHLGYSSEHYGSVIQPINHKGCLPALAALTTIHPHLTV